MADLIDLTGQRFGRLVVVQQCPPDGKRGARWLCECDCGVVKEAHGRDLRAGDSSSCGCLARELHRERVTSHGMRGHPIYRAWRSMRSRCHPSAVRADRYFQRGIGVCARWDRFENFYEDMSPTHSLGMTIERVNNDLGYTPENCVWATMTTQANNKVNNHVIATPLGLMTLAQASRAFFVRPATLSDRFSRGWHPYDALAHAA